MAHTNFNDLRGTHRISERFQSMNNGDETQTNRQTPNLWALPYESSSVEQLQ